MKLQRSPVGRSMRGRRTKGFFLRAETATQVFDYMSSHQVPGYGDRHLSTVSHGESFMQVIEGRFTEPALYLLDEPEAALSFNSCLRLIALLVAVAEAGAQVICATHSPLLAAVPAATIYELSERGIEEVAWEDLELVGHWRRFMNQPESYLRHLD